MSGYIEGKINTQQYSFISICYDEMISENNPVRVLDAFVDSLNLNEMNFKNADRQASLAGRPSYNPKHLLKLYLYGYFNGIRSSRKLAKECERNIEVFWLIDELKPDFRTISNFRRDNINNMKLVFKEFSIFCDSLNLIGKEIVAIDGSKFRANNGRKKNYTKGKIEKQIKYYEENVEKYMELLDKEDMEEKENKVDICKEELQCKIEEAKKRITELEKLKEDVEKNGEKSITDPDSRHMKANNNGTDIAHNIQIAVDSKEHLVVAIDVTSSPANQGQLGNMAQKTKEELGVEEITVLADKGYWNGEELKKCEEKNITAIVSSPNESGSRGYKKSNFKYNKENDVYICPAGKELYRIGATGDVDDWHATGDVDDWHTLKMVKILLGMLWSYLYVRTGKLIIPIVLHSLSNLFSGIIIALIQDKSQEVLSVYGMFMMLKAIAGLICFIKNKKKLSIDNDNKLVKKSVLKDIFTNKGIFFYIALTVTMFVLKNFIKMKFII